MVREFHEKFGHKVSSSAAIPEEAGLRNLRLSLIQEERDELLVASEEGDIVGVADALSDLLYVIYGMGHVYGIDLDRCFAEVHRSNMSKLGEDGRPIIRGDGKILKGPSYSPPDLKVVLGV